MISRSNNSIEGITKLQSICMFSVVLAHCVPIFELDSNPFWVGWGHNFLALYLMPLFMFLSGYLFILTNMKRDVSYATFVLKKAKRLLVPYFAISSVAFVFKSIFSEYALRPIAFELNHYLRGMLFPAENPIILYWFLPTLFLIFLLAPAFKRLILWNNKYILAALFLMLGLLYVLNPLRIHFLNLSGVAEYLIYFYAGCLFCHYCQSNIAKLGKLALTILLFVMLVTGYEVLRRFENPVLRLHLAFLGIIFCYALAFTLAALKLNVTKWIDGYSYQIYLLSWFPQVATRIIFELGIIDYYVSFSLMLIAGLFIPVLAARLVETRLPSMRILIGIK